MSLLSPDVLALARRSVLAWLATVDADGWPNVSPKEVFAATDDGCFVIAHIASPSTVRNLAVQPQACLSFVDVFVQKGYKVKGRATVVPRSHPDFARRAEPLERMVQGRFPIHAVIVLEPQAVAPIVAPSYRLYPSQTTEASQAAAAMDRYGVVPRPQAAVLSGPPPGPATGRPAQADAPGSRRRRRRRVVAARRHRR